MNCSVIKTGEKLIVKITLSERNVEALKSGPISRVTETSEGVRVIMFVEKESNEEHYHSFDREEDFRGIAGGLHRFDEDDPVTIQKKG